MKKFLSLLLCFSIIIGAFAFPASALDITENEDDSEFRVVDIFGFESVLTFEINGDEATLVDCDETIYGVIEIPDTYQGLPVTAIGRRAFRACTGITAVVLPDSVKTIGDEAFAGCSSLTNVEIPESVTQMGMGAFVLCESLEEITLPDSITVISEYAFLECVSLKSVTLGANVTEIKNDAFDGCVSLNEINFPKSVTDIGEFAFWQCPLFTVVISDNVANIGDNAFAEANIGTLRFYSVSQMEKYENYFTADEVICLCEAEHTFSSEYDISCNVCLYKEAVKAPVIAEKTYSYIKLDAVDGYEYSLDGENFQQSNIFDGLYIGTQYTVYQRVKAGGGEEASEISDALSVTTDGFKEFSVAGETADYIKLAENVEDKQTYKVSVKYVSSSDTGLAFMTADSEAVNMNKGYVEAENYALKNTGVTDSETHADIFFTVDKFSDGGVAQGDALYLYVPGGADNIQLAVVAVEMLKDIEDGALIGNGGVSMLNVSDPTATQALRYYFTYDTVSGAEVIIDGTQYPLKSRGFLIANGALVEDAVVTRQKAENNSAIIDMNVIKFDKCWQTSENADGTDNLTFSTYITGFKSQDGGYNYKQKLYVKGYVVIDVNGTEYTLYSAESNYTVSDIASEYYNNLA